AAEGAGAVEAYAPPRQDAQAVDAERVEDALDGVVDVVGERPDVADLEVGGGAVDAVLEIGAGDEACHVPGRRNVAQNAAGAGIDAEPGIKEGGVRRIEAGAPRLDGLGAKAGKRRIEQRYAVKTDLALQDHRLLDCEDGILVERLR